MKLPIHLFMTILMSSLAIDLKGGDDREKGASNGPTMPNVIIILSDDQGYGDFSCHGNPVLETPALDKLYNESLRFDRFHVTPLCTPTRGQLMTGLDAMRNKAATVLTGRNILRRDLLTMPQVFQNNGYATGIFGKWHLGDSYPDRPMDKGFQKCIWHKGWGLLSEMEFDNDYYEPRYLDSLDERFSGEYCTNLWFNKSMEWMGQMVEKNQPFFSFISLNVPHGPFYSQMQDYKYYRDKHIDSTAALFFGMIRNVDRNMERLDIWLEKTGLKNNTLLIYMTDNGGTAGVPVYNAGMRGSKGSNYEGGHRAACFIRWPNGNLGSPRTIEYPAQIQDLLPTFIEMFGLKVEKTYPFDGISLNPLLRRNKKMDNRMFVVQHGGQVRPEKYDGCVVWGTWRLVGGKELYDLKKDPGQERDISSQNPDVLKKLKSFYDKWWLEIEPEIDKFEPIIIDSDKENPVIINSSNWTENAVNTQWRVATAEGGPTGGISHIRVAHGGKYRVELSRWPFHLTRELTLAGPSINIGGTQIRTGKALPIVYGCISINNKDPEIAKCSVDQSRISFDMDLAAGNHTVRAWFRDGNGMDLCGAYYVKVEKID